VIKLIIYLQMNCSGC